MVHTYSGKWCSCENNADLYVVIQKDYLIIMLPGKSQNNEIEPI